MSTKMLKVSVPKLHHLQVTIQCQDHLHYSKMMHCMFVQAFPFSYLHVSASLEVACLQQCYNDHVRLVHTVTFQVNPGKVTII